MKVVHCRKEKCDIYIGRPSKWGNPFPLKKNATKEERLYFYAYLHPSITKTANKVTYIEASL